MPEIAFVACILKIQLARHCMGSSSNKVPPNVGQVAFYLLCHIVVSINADIHTRI